MLGSLYPSICVIVIVIKERVYSSMKIYMCVCVDIESHLRPVVVVDMSSAQVSGQSVSQSVSHTVKPDFKKLPAALLIRRVIMREV